MRYRLELVVAAVVVAVFVVPSGGALAADPRVGVLTSSDSAEFAALVGVNRVDDFENGWYDALDAAGYNPTWITAETIDAAVLADFDVVVLPFTIALADEPSPALLDWVRAGGGMVVEKGSPRVFRDPDGSAPGPFEYWFVHNGGSAFEWGPLSAGYQKDLINDPTPHDFSVLSTGTHPVIQRTLSATGLPSIELRRPNGAGAEFTVPLTGNTNTTPLMTFDVHSTTSNEGVDPTVYDGYQAAEAIRFGHGRIVYWDFLLVDFLIHSDGLQPAGGGLTQREVANELALQSVDWVGESDGSFADFTASARVTTSTNSFLTGLNFSVTATGTGNGSLVGMLHIRVLNPAGKVVYAEDRGRLGLVPGDSVLYYVAYKAGRNLDDGEYTVEAWFASDLPDYILQAAARTHVTRGQGRDIPHAVVAPSISSTGSELIVGYRPATGAIETLVGSSNFGGTVFTGADTFASGSFGGGDGSDLVVYDSSTAQVNYLHRYFTNWSTMFDGHWSRGWTHVIPGDYNGDGASDMLFYRASDGMMVFYTVTATGRFIPITPVMYGNRGWTQLVPGDFNDDGRDDVLWYRAADGLMRYYQVTDDGGFTPITPVMHGNQGWSWIPSGDMDGDGKDDVLWYRSSDGLARLYSIEGARHVPIGPAFSLAPRASQVISADVAGTAGVEVALISDTALTVLDFSAGVMAAVDSAPVVADLRIAAVSG